MKWIGLVLIAFMTPSPPVSSRELRAQQWLHGMQANIRAELRALRIRHQASDNVGIDWRVGDFQEFGIKTNFGTGHYARRVTLEEGTAIWIEIHMELETYFTDIKILLGRDGVVRRMFIDGEEITVPQESSTIQILEQRFEDVTVPAGTFHAKYTKIRETAKDGRQGVYILWLSDDVTMGGLTKQLEGSAVIELTAFGIR